MRLVLTIINAVSLEDIVIPEKLLKFVNVKAPLRTMNIVQQNAGEREKNLKHAILQMSAYMILRSAAEIYVTVKLMATTDQAKLHVVKRRVMEEAVLRTLPAKQKIQHV